MDDRLDLDSSKAVELEWLAASPWVEFIFYVNPLRVIPEFLNGTSHRFAFCICTNNAGYETTDAAAGALQ